MSGAIVEKRHYVSSGINTFSRPAGISTEAAVWITKEADDSPRFVLPAFLLLKKNNVAP